MAGEGEKVGQEFDRGLSNEVEPKVDQMTKRVTGKMRKQMSKAGDDSGKSFGEKFFRGFEKVGKKVPIGKILMIGGIASAIGPLISLVEQLGGGLYALSSSILSVARAAPVAGYGLLAMVSIMGTIKLASAGTGKAIKDGMSGNIKLMTQDMKKMVPAQQQFVKFIVGLKPQLDSLKQTAASNMFPGLTDGMKGAMPLLGPFRDMIAQVAQAIGGLSRYVGELLGGPLKGEMENIFNTNAGVVNTLAHALGYLVDIVVRLMNATAPLATRFIVWLDSELGLIDAQVKLKESTGQLASSMADAGSTASTLWHIVSNLVGTLVNIGHAAKSSGDLMLSSIEATTAKWRAFTGEVSTQNQMVVWFDKARQTMEAFIGLLGDVGKSLHKIGGSVDLTSLINQFRDQLLPAVTKLLTVSSGDLASKFIDLLTNIVNVLTDLASSGAGGFLTTFVTTLDDLAKALNAILTVPGVGTVAGTLLSIGGAVAAIAYASSKLHLGALISLLTAFGAGAKEGATGVDALAAAKAREKEAMKDNPEHVKKNTSAFDKFKGVVGSAGKAVGKFAGPVLGGLAASLGPEGIGALLATVGEAIAGAAAAILAPILAIPAAVLIAIVAAVVAIGVGIYEAIKHWGAIKDFFTHTFPQWFVDGFHAVAKFFTKILPEVFGMVGVFLWQQLRKIPGLLAKLPGLLWTAIKGIGKALLTGFEWALAAVIALFILLPAKILYELYKLGRKIAGEVPKIWHVLYTSAKTAVDKTVGFFEKLPGRVGRALASMGRAIKHAATSAFHWLVNAAKSTASSTVHFFTTLPGRVGRALSHLGSAIKHAATSAFHWLVHTAQSTVTSTAHFFATLPGKIGHALAKLPGQLLHTGGDMMHKFKAGIDAGWHAVAHFFTSLPGTIEGYFKDAVKWLYNAGKDLMQGFINGMESMGKSVWKKAKGIVNKIPGVHMSPSIEEIAPILLRDSGRMLMRGFMAGVEDEHAALVHGIQRHLVALRPRHGGQPIRPAMVVGRAVHAINQHVPQPGPAAEAEIATMADSLRRIEHHMKRQVHATESVGDQVAGGLDGVATRARHVARNYLRGYIGG